MRKRTIAMFAALSVSACVVQSGPQAQAPQQPPAAKGQLPDAESDAESDAPPASSVALPDCVDCYPEYGAAGLTMMTRGGPYGEQVYQGTPRESNYTKQFAYLYSQTDTVIPDQAELTYTIRLLGRENITVGEHAVDNGMTVYGFDSTTTEYEFAGKVRVDEIDRSSGRFQFAFYGTMSGDGAQFPVQGYIDLISPVGS